MQIRGGTVLVTGAGGFIGSHLVEHLLGCGCRVRALLHYDSRPGHGNLDQLDPSTPREALELLEGDIRDPHLVREAVHGCDAVFHLAALISVPYSYTAPASFVATNIGGTLNVLEACRGGDVQRVVVTSTSEVYGTARRVPIDEEHPLQAQSPYSASKMSADKLAESYHRTFDLPVSVLRPFNNYGPRQSRRAVIPQIGCQLLSDEPSLRLGSLWPRRDFLFVEDTCEAFVRMAECDEAVGQTVNVGTGRSISIGELAELMMEVSGVHKPIVADDRRLRPDRSEVGELRCDASLARRLLGWTPTTDLRAGLDRVLRSLQEPHAGPGRSSGYRV